MNQLLVSDKE